MVPSICVPPMENQYSVMKSSALPSNTPTFLFRKIHLLESEQAERAIGVSNSLEGFREVAELILKVYLSMEAESVIGVSNSYDLAWSGLKSKHFR